MLRTFNLSFYLKGFLWEWNDKSKRYHRTDEEGKKGRFIGSKEMAGMRNRFVDAGKVEVADLVRKLHRGDIDISTWYAETHKIVQRMHFDQYALAKGGVFRLGLDDYQNIDMLVKRQKPFLLNFANDILSGKYTDEQMETWVVQRAGMYADASVGSYEYGRAAAFDVTSYLTAWPASGQTQCLTNCRCFLDYKISGSVVQVFWINTSKKPCDDCKGYANLWNPLEIAVHE